jgi:peptidoglycan/xylan/chitin deacetylase (PgdA/CDA1 family)
LKPESVALDLIKKLKGRIAIGSHTLTHRTLSNIPKKEVEAEVSDDDIDFSGISDKDESVIKTDTESEK